ncbi:hypothetical protein NDN08_002124 [Rhodosorus marinus]|uniref:Protochlorophyllide reductase n=1 Tax=Rhodosorus marinus TaxID=101924 RepID=A0AAV8UWZ2_9RHOD|nr:hypothetical protein NDN08_002124 [Rhodosorus marinus]
MGKGWTADDIPDLDGKVAIVTGSNHGIGREIAKRLAEHNATTVMACRTAQKAEIAKQELLEEIGEEKHLVVLTLDVSSLESIRNFSREFSSKYKRLDVLMENAGQLTFGPRQESVDGLELQLATNHVGQFALATHLMSMLTKTEGSRLVTQSSSASWIGKFDWDNLQGEKTYSTWSQYAMTRLANVAFAKELNSRLEASGKSFPTAYAVHPGFVMKELEPGARQGMLQKIGSAVVYPLAGTLETAARPALYACTAPDITPGAFYGPQGPIPIISAMNGQYPGENYSNKIVLDADQRSKLWEVSEQLCKAQLKI